MKIKKSFFAISAIIFGLSCSLSIINVSEPFKIINTNAEERSITLTSETVPTISDALGTLQLDDFQTINYIGVREAAGYHVLLDAYGTIEKYESTYSLTSVTAVFEGELVFESDYQANFNTDHIFTYLTSGETYSVSGNHWVITASTDTYISSITITYGCFTEAVDPGTNSTVTGIQSVQKYGDIVEEDGTIYFSVKGTYDITAGRLITSDLSIAHDNGAYPLACSFINIDSVNTFTAYFDVSTNFETILGSNESFTYYPHLYVRGTAWDGAYGNIGMPLSTFRDSTQKLYERSLTVNGNQCISLSRYKTGSNSVMPTLIYEHKNVIDFNNNFTDNPSRAEDIGNPFAHVNGGSTSVATYSKEFGIYRYGNNINSVYTTTIVANQAATVTFYIVSGGRSGTTFAADSTAGAVNYLSSMTINDDTTGVVLSNTTYEFVNSYGNTTELWHRFIKVEAATLDLVAGKNVISFTFCPSDSKNNMNISGISFASDDASLKLNLYKKYEIKYANTPSDINNEYNPFADRYHGSVNDEILFDYSNSSLNYCLESSAVGYRYGEGKSKIFTTTLFAEEATTINFGLLASSAANRTFRYNKTVGESTAIVYISLFKLNGETSGITADDTLTTFPGWTTTVDTPVASLSLRAGTNYISFVFNGDKINISGISVESSTPVYLSEKADQYRFDTNFASTPESVENNYNPFATVNGGSVNDGAEITSTSTPNYKLNSGAYVYGEGRGYKFECSVVVSQATTATFVIIGSSGSGRTFRADKDATETIPSTYISSLLVNGSSDNVILSDTLISTIGWTTRQDFEVATISLIPGANTISFIFDGNNKSLAKINVAGIVLYTDLPVRLGS